MVWKLVLLAAVLLEGADGKPILPPLPIKGERLSPGRPPGQPGAGTCSTSPVFFPPSRRLLRGVYGGGAVPGGGRGGRPLLPDVQQSAADPQNRPLLGKLHHYQGQRERVCGWWGPGARPAERQAAVVPPSEGFRLGGIHLYLQVGSGTTLTFACRKQHRYYALSLTFSQICGQKWNVLCDREHPAAGLPTTGCRHAETLHPNKSHRGGEAEVQMSVRWFQQHGQADRVVQGEWNPPHTHTRSKAAPQLGSS